MSLFSIRNTCFSLFVTPTLTLFNMTFVAELVNYFTTKEKSFSATPDYFSKIYSQSLTMCMVSGTNLSGLT